MVMMEVKRMVVVEGGVGGSGDSGGGLDGGWGE